MDFQSLGSWHASHSLLFLGFASVRWVGWGPGFPALYSTQSFWRNSTAVLGSVQSCLLAVLVLFPPQIGSLLLCWALRAQVFFFQPFQGISPPSGADNLAWPPLPSGGRNCPCRGTCTFSGRF